MKNKKKIIAVLGSTGSIGTQTLNVIKNNASVFKVTLLSANSNVELLSHQADIFKPNYLIINCVSGYKLLKKKFSSSKTKVLCGVQQLCDLLLDVKIDLVVSAIVGAAGLLPTISAIRGGKNIALANKESLVIAGELIMGLIKENNVSILPIDSEHSAIFQCLVGEDPNSIKKLILTASGGPFLNLSKDDFKNVTPQKALKHPNWDMGKKITVDSSTLMNKGLEVIEARWLFNINVNDIDVVIHPQSIIHSLVQFSDGSTKAQLGMPTMITPIVYALFYPQRGVSEVGCLDFKKVNSLSFIPPDTVSFPHLKVAYEALERGGVAPCVINAANEVAVHAFLNKKIAFLDMIKIVEKSLESFIFVKNPKLEDFLNSDLETRKYAKELIKKI